jgi:hypothetical protein
VLYDPLAGKGRGDLYCDILSAVADEGNALEVFQWLAKSKDTYFFRPGIATGRNFNRLQSEFSSVLSSVLRNEDIDAAAYMMDMPRALGYSANRMSDDARRHYVIESANACSIKSLDFLCDRWGPEMVTNYVRDMFYFERSPDGEDWVEPSIYDDCREEIETWLHDRAKVVSTTAKEHLMNAMTTLDENKQLIAEGDFLKIVNELQEVYRWVDRRFDS